MQVLWDRFRSFCAKGKKWYYNFIFVSGRAWLGRDSCLLWFDRHSVCFFWCCCLHFQHHCRNCGDIFCDKCTQGRITLTADETAAVRVCDQCMVCNDVVLKCFYFTLATRGKFPLSLNLLGVTQRSWIPEERRKDFFVKVGPDFWRQDKFSALKTGP